MKRLSAPIGTALLVLLAAAASQVRADHLSWTYTTSTSTPGVSVGNNLPSGGASVSLTGFNTAQTGGASIPLIAYETISSASTPVSFDNSKYSLALKLTDTSTGASKTLDFSGKLNGSLSSTSSSLFNTITPVTSSVSLDGHTFTVSIPKVELAAPSAVQQDILANVTVSNGSLAGGHDGGTHTSSSPEPASLLLGSLGFSCFGLGCWWKRRRRSAEPMKEDGEDD